TARARRAASSVAGARWTVVGSRGPAPDEAESGGTSKAPDPSVKHPATAKSSGAPRRQDGTAIAPPRTRGSTFSEAGDVSDGRPPCPEDFAPAPACPSSFGSRLLAPGSRLDEDKELTVSSRWLVAGSRERIRDNLVIIGQCAEYYSFGR